MTSIKAQKPFKTYLGGKEASGVYQTIINNIPKHKTLIIPFLGNCAIYRNIKAADTTILIDKDPSVIQAWCTNFKNEVGSSSSKFICGDAISYLQKYREDADHTFIYADPPYLIETRSSKNSKYAYDFTEKDHVSLLKVLLQMNCKIAISTYPNKLYYRMLFGWKCISYKSKTRSGQRTELLYMNYDINELELHDYSYLGKNFRERERIKKKIDRHSARLMMLNRMESLAILERLSLVRNTINGDQVPIIIKNDVSGSILINNDACSSNSLNCASKVQPIQTLFPESRFNVT